MKKTKTEKNGNKWTTYTPRSNLRNNWYSSL